MAYFGTDPINWVKCQSICKNKISPITLWQFLSYLARLQEIFRNILLRKTCLKIVCVCVYMCGCVCVGVISHIILRESPYAFTMFFTQMRQSEFSHTLILVRCFTLIDTCFRYTLRWSLSYISFRCHHQRNKFFKTCWFGYTVNRLILYFSCCHLRLVVIIK